MRELNRPPQIRRITSMTDYPAPLGSRKPQPDLERNWRHLLVGLGLIACLLGLARARQNSLSHLNWCTTQIGMVVGSALEVYASDNQGHYPRSMPMIVRDHYLKSIPTCPAAGKVTYVLDYQVSPTGDTYSFSCHGNHHWLAWRVLGLPEKENCPFYHSSEGLTTGRSS